MSKFFKQTRKAQDWALRQGAADKPDVEQMLERVRETVKEVDAVGDQMSDSRLARCRKIRLARAVGSPIISGGDEFLAAAAESYRALRTRVIRERAANGLRSVVISSASQAEGKTLTAMNLALSCARLQGTRVLLIDADLRTRGLTQLLGYPTAPGLAEVLAGQAQFEDAILATDVPNLYALAAGTPAAPPPELYAGDRWKEFIGWASEFFKIILVDSPPIVPLTDFELISAGCDAVLVVVRALSTRRELLQSAASRIDKKKLLGVVFNATPLNGEKSCYNYMYPSGNNKHV